MLDQQGQLESAQLRRRAEALAAELQRRAEVMTAHLVRAGVLLAHVAPAAAAQLLRELDEEERRQPELGPSLRPVHAAVAAELAGGEAQE